MMGLEPRELTTYPRHLVTNEVTSQVGVKESPESTQITLYWSRLSGSVLLLLAAGANLVCAYLANHLQQAGTDARLSGDFQAQLWILMCLHAIALILSYSGLAQVLNRTTIEVSREHVRVRTLPLVTLMNGSAQLNDREIREVVVHPYANWDGGARFHLLARTADARAKALIFGLADQAVATFLAFAIQEARAKFASAERVDEPASSNDDSGNAQAA